MREDDERRSRRDKKLKLGDSQGTPLKYSRSLKRLSLGMPKASPSSSTIIRSFPLKLRFYYFTYYMQFLERIYVLLSVLFVYWSLQCWNLALLFGRETRSSFSRILVMLHLYLLSNCS